MKLQKKEKTAKIFKKVLGQSVESDSDSIGPEPDYEYTSSDEEIEGFKKHNEVIQRIKEITMEQEILFDTYFGGYDHVHGNN